MFNPYQAQIQQLEEKIQENQTLLEDPELAKLAKSEIKNLTEQKEALEKAARDLADATAETNNPADVSKANAILEIRGGTGGDEAKIWANDLLRMYLRFIENTDLKAEFLEEMVIKIKGKTEINGEELRPYEVFKFDSGVHRVQRVPTTESQGRIHTSTASVAVLPEVTATAIEIKDEDLEWQFIRAGGAGGQSVNKTSSAVRLTHKPSGVSVSSSRERKQVQNRQIALELLRSKLWEIEEEKRLAKVGEARSTIGRNMRAEKIRTYNFPQNRVTDHRINESWHDLENILDGGIKKVLETVREKMLEEENL